MDWFVFNTKDFMLTVPEDKLDKALQWIRELRKKEEKRIEVKALASVAGLIGSFGLAMGCRVHT